ncbi:hypothetical protein DFJ77DRAFT_451352 [Powellomyces hirtus]|nr:hypothetical protein DFJ77DRAFT_451352 [Powellomyces hirtus]
MHSIHSIHLHGTRNISLQQITLMASRYPHHTASNANSHVNLDMLSTPAILDKRTYSTTDLPFSASASSLRSRASFKDDLLPMGAHALPGAPPPAEDMKGSNRSLFKPPSIKTDPDAGPKIWTLKAILTEMVALPLTMFISLFSYCPFCIAVVVQSTITKHAVDTDKWQDEMKGWAWIIGLLTFFGLLLYPTGVVSWMEDAPIPVVRATIATFLGVLGVVQALTIAYAFLKPGLGMVTVPADQKLNVLHWRNILVLVAPLAEFLQFTALAFKTLPDSWLCITGFGTAVRAFTRGAGLRLNNLSCDSESAETDWQTPDMMLDSAMLAFSLSLIYAICLGYAIAKLLQPGHWLCAMVFEVFAGIGYIPIVSRLMSLLSCHSEVNADGSTSLYLSYAESNRPSLDVPCWTGRHKKYGAMAFAGLLLFGLSATFVGSYKADKHVRRSAVTFIPRLVVIRRTLNSTLLAVNLLLTYAVKDPVSLAHATQASGMTVLCALLVLDTSFNSCTFHEIRLLATGAHLAALWSYITTLVVGTNKWAWKTSVIVLLSGWFVVAAGVAAGLIWTNKASESDALFKHPEDGRLAGSGETTFKVVTLRRRLRVVVKPGDDAEEEQIIAAAIYGGHEVPMADLKTLQHISEAARQTSTFKRPLTVRSQPLEDGSSRSPSIDRPPSHGPATLERSPMAQLADERRDRRRSTRA